jgi:MYXO-CTERM domain-containing protein
MAILAAPIALTPDTAEACGGTFCDVGPQSMPVDQTGENILFVFDGGRVQAHIQIQYEGEAAKFAWVIPVTALPDIRVGSQALFDNMLQGTVPTFTLQTTFEPCPDQRDLGGFGCGGFAAEDAAGFADSGGFFGDGDGDGDGGPNVAARGVAGAFEYAVLQGGTAQEVMDWLGDNGYQQDPAAEPILGDYLDDDYLFVAVKLRPGADTDEIQPLVLEYDGTEPCIPIKLTAIAATDDMGIRTFFLGADRTFPQNYAHVLLNWAKLDWIGLGLNYQDVVTAAVDEAPDGQGFVTEYAGTPDVVATDGILGPQWSASAFASAAPEDVVTLLEGQGLMQCSTSACEFFHPMVEPLLQAYLPVPSGVSPVAFYDCLSCYVDQIDPNTMDGSLTQGETFADAFAERIVNPGVEAISLLQDKSYLTRLYTTISPHEMTRDPTFHQNSDADDLSNQWSATQHVECEGSDWLELADGTVINFDENNAAPTFEDMPSSNALETVPASGAAMVDTDNAGEIGDILEDWNAANPAGPSTGCGCTSSQHGPGALYSLFMLALIGGRRRHGSKRTGI